MAKNKISQSGIVYSTDPSFSIREEEKVPSEEIPPALQNIIVRLDKKQRAGKAVTLVEGFNGSEQEEEELGKKLKSFCGTGGTVKNGEILVQGDNRDKILLWLQKNGFTKTKKL